MDQFLYLSLCLLSSDAVPRISTKIKRILHLNEQSKVGDWYLYQNFIEIRVYGCEFPPFKLSVFVPVRIFALEFIRQRLNKDEIHFVSRKQKAQFKLKAPVGPFIVNTRAAEKEVENLLRQMKFKLSFSWPYDRLGVISSMKIE